ncbi:MAG TPA: YtxH domain-containing protein [Nocardioidaceae bacterium]|jgi:SLT domain-containing protein|nr:YtxH domain-containing protein [Nocardioidaceae bacterium]
MRGKISLLAGGAIGYVLGTRAGRERYEQIRSQAQSFWNNPKVQQKASQAQDLAREKAPLIKDKVSDSGTASTSGVTSPGQHREEPAPYPTSASTGLS